MAVGLERVFARDSHVCVYWLAHCEGFAVRAGRRRLGVVESVVSHEPFGGADLLLLRTHLGRRVLPLDRIDAAVPARRLLVAHRAERRHRVAPRLALLASGGRSAASAAAVLLVGAARLGLIAARLCAGYAAAGVRVAAPVAARELRRLPPLSRRGARELRELAGASAAGVQELATLVRQAIADNVSYGRRL